jgi:hypothetical protein
MTTITPEPEFLNALQIVLKEFGDRNSRLEFMLKEVGERLEGTDEFKRAIVVVEDWLFAAMSELSAEMILAAAGAIKVADAK